MCIYDIYKLSSSYIHNQVCTVEFLRMQVNRYSSTQEASFMVVDWHVSSFFNLLCSDLIAVGGCVCLDLFPAAPEGDILCGGHSVSLVTKSNNSAYGKRLSS